MSSSRRRPASSRSTSPSRKIARSPEAKAPVWHSLLNWFGGEGRVALPKRAPANRKWLKFESLEERTVLAADITFAANVLTINITGAGETVDLAVNGTDLEVTSSAGTTADAAAVALGFEAVQAGLNNGSLITVGSEVHRIDIIGSTGTQTLNINGGTFTALTVVNGAEDVENVNFAVAGSTFSKLAVAAADANLNVFASDNLTQAVGATISTTDGGDITLELGSGDITVNAAITATGGDGDVDITAEDDVTLNAAVSAVGLGTIEITAEPGGGAGTFTSNVGGTVTTADGNIDITAADNVFLNDAVFAGGTGDITIISEPTTGISAAAGNFTSAGLGTVTTVDGDITIASGDAIDIGAAVSAGLTGNIIIDADRAIDNIGDFQTTATGTLSTAGGNVTITATDIDLLGAVGAGVGIVTLRDRAAGGALDLGTELGGANNFGVTDADLDLITAGVIRVGDAAAGAITVTAAISPALSATLSLITGAGVTQGANTITVANLAVQAVGAVTLGAANEVTNLAVDITGAGNDLAYADATGFNIDTVDGVAGLDTTGAGDVVTLTAGGAVTQSATGTINSTFLELLGTGSYVLENVGNDVVNLSADLATAGTGTLSYVDADPLNIGVAGGTIGITTNDSDVTVRTVNGFLTVQNDDGDGTPDVDAGAGSVTLIAGSIGAVDQPLTINAGAGVIGTGGVTLIGDEIIINADVDAGTSTAVLQPFQDGTDINLGAASVIVNEVEANDTFATPQVVGTLIAGTALVVEGTGNSSFDYYSFDVTAAGIHTIEITAGNFDTELFLYDAAGNLLSQDDDGGVGLLSRITFAFPAAGTFVIAVGEFSSSDDGTNTGTVVGNTPDAGEVYTLVFDPPADPIGLDISDAEIDLITAGNVIIGSETTGNITVVAPIDPAGTTELIVATGGGAVIDGNAADPDFTVASLALAGLNGVGVGDAIETSVSNLEALAETGGIFIDNSGAGALNLGDVIGLLVPGVTFTGIAVEISGDIVITNDDTINLTDTDGTETVKGGDTSGDVFLTATGATADVTSTVDEDAINAPAGSIFVDAGQDILFGTVAASADNDVRADVNIVFTAGRDITIAGFADIASDNNGNDTGGDVEFTAGRDINISQDNGDDASVSALGGGGGNVTFTAGADSFVRLTAGFANAVLSNSGSVTINADRVLIDADSGIDADVDVNFFQVSANWNIDLGSATDVAVDTLELSDAELDRVIAGEVLRIGDLTNAGNGANAGITVTDTIDLPATQVTTLSLQTAGGIIDGTAGEQTDIVVGSALITGSLALQASLGIGSANDLDVQVDEIALANLTNGFVNVTNIGDLTITTVDGVVGAVNNSGFQLIITAADDGVVGVPNSITVDENVTAIGSIILTASNSPDAGDDLTVSAGVTIESFTNDIDLRAGDTVRLEAATATVAAFDTLTITGGLSEIDGGGGVNLGLVGTPGGVISGVVVVINGGAGEDLFNLNPVAAPALISVFGLAGDDVFNVTPQLATAFAIDGGSPVLPVFPGDELNVDFTGFTTISFIPGAPSNGTFTFGVEALQIDFVSIENVPFSDFGDADVTFGAAEHVLSNGLFLGAAVDFDIANQPTVGADGDDNDADGDDEDGVVFADTIPGGNGDIIAGLPNVVTVTASAPGLLDAWIDFDGNGTFDADERITPAGGQPVVVGVNDVGFVVPAVGTTAGTHATRFRVSTVGGLAPVGVAADGEVEDGLVDTTLIPAGGPPVVIAGQLIVSGTGLNDNIQIFPKVIGGVDNIRVTIKTTGVPKATFDIPAAGVTSIAAFGLAGNDTIKVNAKILLPAVLLGNEGNDKVTGGGGNDVIRGGDGNDTLRGANGNDVLLGEAGNDSIDGQGGFDIAIGGTGVDRVRSTRSQDILIGGTTNFDLNDAALLQLMAQWSNGLSFEQRTVNLAANVLANVNDDGARDVLHSGVALLSRDWFINFTNEDFINFKFGSDRLN